MRKKFAHITAFFFAMLLLLPVLFYSGLEAFQAYYKLTVSQRMEAKPLQNFSFPLENVVWEDDQKEISVNGTLYDLKSFSIEKGWLKVKGVLDEAETEIHGLLIKMEEEELQSMYFYLLFYAQIFVVFTHYCLRWQKYPPLVSVKLGIVTWVHQNPMYSPPYPPPKL